VSGYLARVLRILEHILPGTVARITVSHDHWCAYWTGAGRCDCDPDLVVRRDDLEEST